MYKNIPLIGFLIGTALGTSLLSGFYFIKKLNKIEKKFDNYFENGKKSFYNNDVRLLMSLCLKDLIEKDNKELAEKLYTTWNDNTSEDFMLH